MSTNSVSARAFSAIQKVDTVTLSKLSERELRPLLPCLVRMALCPPLDVSGKWAKKRKEVLKILAGIEFVNSLVGLLSIDFHSLEIDIKKEQSLRYLRLSLIIINIVVIKSSHLH